MRYFQLIILSLHFLIFLDPLITEPLYFLILFQYFKEMVVSLISLIFIDEGVSFSDCLYERKQSFLVGLVHG